MKAPKRVKDSNDKFWEIEKIQLPTLKGGTKTYYVGFQNEESKSLRETNLKTLIKSIKTSK
jgi:hypothetical protein